MKILVADDELVSRRKLQKIMEYFGSAEAVESGSGAVKAFQKAWEEGEPYDLLTLDIAMPDMDGTEVLYAIREIEKGGNISKRTRVLMVTAQSDKDTVVTCIQAGCDGFVVKPFNKETIEKRLKDLGVNIPAGDAEEKTNEEKTRQEPIREDLLKIIQKFKKGDIQLPVLPDVVQEVERVIKQPGSTIDELCQVIEKDAVISARLIATANSPLYRGLDSVRTVNQAISRLGFKEAQKVVVAIASKALYMTKNKQLQDLMEKLRAYSLASAHAASQLARKLGFKDAEKYFLMGLIHDIGNVLLLWTVGEITAQDETIDLNDVVSSTEELHNVFGAALLERWQFSKEFIEVARMHEGPGFDSKTAKEILIVNLASNLVFKMGYGFYEREGTELLELDAAKLLHIDSATLEAISEEVKRLFELSTGVL